MPRFGRYKVRRFIELMLGGGYRADMDTTRRTAFAALTALGAAIALSACSSGGVTPDQAQTSVTQAVAAIQLAESKTSGVAFAIDAEGSGGWDIDVVANDEVFEVRVNLEGTSVTSTRADGRIDVDDRMRLEAAKVTLADAVKTASGEVVGTLAEAELDRFLTAPVVWSVTIEDGSGDVEVSVDVATGKVVNVERD